MSEHPPASQPLSPPRAAPGPRALHRSGVVARMLGMPVATLRVWERRYRLTQTALSPGGQRLYTADDVQRLALVKQLTDRGHAIGSLAALTLAQLQQVALAHEQTRAATSRPVPGAQGAGAPAPAAPGRAAGGPPGGAGVQAGDAAGPFSGRVGANTGMPAAGPGAGRPLRLAVVGAALGARLQRPGLAQRLASGVQVLGPFDSAAQAAQALLGQPPDALLLHEPELHDGWLAAQHAAAPAWARLPRAVLYRFAADPVCEALATAGVNLLREPQPDAVLAQWLQRLHGDVNRSALALPPWGSGRGWPWAGDADAAAPVVPRRWDDEALAGFAALSSTIACECPRHLAELLVQLSHFESYSASCEHRSAEHAELHAYLRQVAALSRASFEAALERVAMHEGLALPP